MLDPSSEGIILVYVTLEMLDETPRNRAQKPSKEVSNSCDVFIPTLPTPPPLSWSQILMVMRLLLFVFLNSVFETLQFPKH